MLQRNQLQSKQARNQINCITIQFCNCVSSAPVLQKCKVVQLQRRRRSALFILYAFFFSYLFLVLFVLLVSLKIQSAVIKAILPPSFFYIYIFSYWSKTGAEEQHRTWSPELNKVFNLNKNTPLSTPRQPTFGTCINLALKRLRFNVGMSLCE